MIKVEYPTHDFRMKKENDKEFIFDELRKIWLRLTPEEWVRQNFLQYLLQVKKFPSSLIALEKRILVGELNKRFDILIYDKDHLPWMMVECKAMQIALQDEVLQQVLRYNIAVPVPYLVITNGSYCVAYEKKNNRLEILREIPLWNESKGMRY